MTPRNWLGKTAWEEEKNALGMWKAVRALDASDLEQWLEESVPAQLWLAEKLGRPAEGCQTLDEFWERWAGAAHPPLPTALFSPSVNHHRNNFKLWLDNPSERVFIVSADSAGEAVAFLACLFRDGAIAPRVRDLAAVFESAKTLRSLATSTAPFLPIAANPEAEKELAPLYRRFHTIAVRPRNDVETEPDIALDLLTHEAFIDALSAPAWRIADPERRATRATATHDLLDRVSRTPGTQQDGTVDRDELLAWLNETRRLSAEYARPEIGDQCIGQLLARSSPGPDGSWPSPAVCEAMETIASQEIGIGFRVGVCNSRGFVWRGEGGDQERGLAAHYRTRAAELAIECPYVSGVLEDIARSYDRDAQWHDNESALRHRLGH